MNSIISNAIKCNWIGYVIVVGRVEFAVGVDVFALVNRNVDGGGAGR